MKTALRLFVLLICLGSLAAAVWLWFFLRPFAEVFVGVGHVRHEWNQKLTLTVETPQGERSGSAVVRVVADFGKFLSGNEVVYAYYGEATVVEVLPDRFLFALISGSEQRFYAAAKDRFPGLKRSEWLYEIPKQTEPVELTGDRIPLLVTFDDIHDPKTVRQVDPADLVAIFGPGVRLKAVTLAVTKEPVTEGRVEGALGWFCGHVKPYRRLSGKSGPIADNELANNLGPGVFSTGTCK